MGDEENEISNKHMQGFAFKQLVDKAVEIYLQEIAESGAEVVEDDYTDMSKALAKSVRALFAAYLIDLEVKKTDPLFHLIMNKAKKLKNKRGFSTDEAIQASLSYWKYAIAKLIPPMDSLFEVEDE